jgi:hypothetical protein
MKKKNHADLFYVLRATLKSNREQNFIELIQRDKCQLNGHYTPILPHAFRIITQIY